MDMPGHELAASLQNNIESFDDIPVVSFGWVALFIFLYILIVGPLDYLFLKKVVGRLELTWITFPALKGNDLRINKVDLVDIDMQSGRSYGQTWFTLFSPRIQNYTIGVEPAYQRPGFPAAGWTRPPAPDKDNDFSVVVGWMGRPENVWGGSGRASGGGLFRRAYTYEPNASGLDLVPIQVWATKSFTASWEAAFPPNQPLVVAELRHTRASPENVDGPITSQLPVELEDVALLYRGNVYPIGRLAPGIRQLINTGQQAQGKSGQPLDNWFPETTADPYHKAPQMTTYGGPRQMGAIMGDSSLGFVLKTAFFFRKSPASSAGYDNATLRFLDQSWRLSKERENEVILVGRTAFSPAGPADDVTADGATASRLWLGAIPAPNKERPPLAGNLLQRTFVRVFIPVN
jgi:hypothetical protein